MQNWLRHRAEN